MQALAVNPKNRIAMYYLAEFAFARGEYARAATLYSELTANKQRASRKSKRSGRRPFFWRPTTCSALPFARKAKGSSLKPKTSYRQALKVAPNDPLLQTRLADLMIRTNKKDEADATRKTAETVAPRKHCRTRKHCQSGEPGSHKARQPGRPRTLGKRNRAIPTNSRCGMPDSTAGCCPGSSIFSPRSPNSARLLTS